MTTPARPPLARGALPLLLIPLVALPSLAIILSGDLSGRAGYDQSNFHEPAIRSFAAHLPAPDLRDYPSATTPLYHLVLALIARLIHDSREFLQGCGLVFSATLVWLLGTRAARRTPHLALDAAPFAASMYVLASAAWLLPDNAGWLGVLGVLLLALRDRASTWTFPAAGLCLLALVLTRQVHLWAAAPIWAAAFLSSGRHPGLALLRASWTLPAFAAVVAFYSLWGGLVPPSFQGQYPRAINPAAPAFILSLLGGFGVFYSIHLVPALRHPRRWTIPAAMLAAALLALAFPTSFDKEAGRWSGLWNVARDLPAPAGRSLLIVPLAALGGGILAAWALVLPRNSALVLGSALAGFVAAQSASLQLWQRYNEPFVLMLLALAASSLESSGPGRRWIGPTLLAALLGAFSLGAHF